MEYAGVLQGIAEVAIGLTGFAGIAAGLGYRVHAPWSEQDKKRLESVIMFGIATIYACFLPYAVHFLGTNDPWRIASMLCLVIPCRALYAQYKVLRFSPAGYSIAAFGVLIGLEFIVICLLLCIIFEFVIAQQAFGFYLCSVLIILSLACFLFYRLLQTSFSHNAVVANTNASGPQDQQTQLNNAEPISDDLNF